MLKYDWGSLFVGDEIGWSVSDYFRCVAARRPHWEASTVVWGLAHREGVDPFCERPNSPQRGEKNKESAVFFTGHFVRGLVQMP